jgi:hypothetical protein
LEGKYREVVEALYIGSAGICIILQDNEIAPNKLSTLPPGLRRRYGI